MEQHGATKHLEPTKCTLARHVDPEMGIWPQLHGLQQHAPLYVSSLAASTGKTLPRERWLKDCQGNRPPKDDWGHHFSPAKP